MPKAGIARIGRRGVVVIPAALRHALGLDEGTLVVVEREKDGVLIRPATVGRALPPVEVYTPKRKAEFLLNNATDAASYRWARREVRAMGLDPDAVKHLKPSDRTA